MNPFQPNMNYGMQNYNQPRMMPQVQPGFVPGMYSMQQGAPGMMHHVHQGMMANPIVAKPVLDVPPTMPAPPRVTTVFVGKLPGEVDDEYIRNLLMQCGRLIKWNRSTDPVSGQLKSFGLADFALPLQALVAIRVLNDFSLSGSQLLVKVDTKTQESLDEALASLGPKVVEDETEKATKKVEMLINAGITTSVIAGTMPKTEEVVIDYEDESTKQKVSLVSAEVMRFRETQSKEENKKRDELAEHQKSKLRAVEREIEKIRKQRERDYERDSKKKEHEEEDYRNRMRVIEDLEYSRKKDAEIREKRESERLSERRKMIDLEKDIDSHEWKSMMRSQRRARARQIEREADERDRKREEEELIELERQRKEELKRQEEDQNIAPVSVKLDNKKRARFIKASDQAFEEENEEEIDENEKQKKRRPLKKLEVTADDVKTLIQQIPTESSALFNYDLNWEQCEKAQIVEGKLRPWVTKKIVEYLGEEEPTLCNFILEKLKTRCKAEEIIEQLKVVLEDDTELLVKKLWRALIYHTLESELTLLD